MGSLLFTSVGLTVCLERGTNLWCGSSNPNLSCDAEPVVQVEDGAQKLHTFGEFGVGEEPLQAEEPTRGS